MNDMKSCLFCQYAIAEEYPFDSLECSRFTWTQDKVKYDFVCEDYEYDYKMRKVFEGEEADE